MQDFSLTAAAAPLVVVETDSEGARSSVVVAWLAEHDGDQVTVSPVVVSHEGTGGLLRVVRDRGPGHAAIVPCKDIQGMAAGDVAAIAQELSNYKGAPKRMVSRSRT